MINIAILIAILAVSKATSQTIPVTTYQRIQLNPNLWQSTTKQTALARSLITCGILCKTAADTGSGCNAFSFSFQTQGLRNSKQRGQYLVLILATLIWQICEVSLRSVCFWIPLLNPDSKTAFLFSFLLLKVYPIFFIAV